MRLTGLETLGPVLLPVPFPSPENCILAMADAGRGFVQEAPEGQRKSGRQQETVVVQYLQGLNSAGPEAEARR